MANMWMRFQSKTRPELTRLEIVTVTVQYSRLDRVDSYRPSNGRRLTESALEASRVSCRRGGQWKGGQR